MSELPVRPDDLRALAGLFSPGIVADPYPVYARWRAERPVARPRERPYVLSRFADCEAVLADPAALCADPDYFSVRRGMARHLRCCADLSTCGSSRRPSPAPGRASGTR